VHVLGAVAVSCWFIILKSRRWMQTYVETNRFSSVHS